MEINQEIIADMELNDTTDVKVQETIEQMETPAEDVQDVRCSRTVRGGARCAGREVVAAGDKTDEI